jgi:hypothetical protein
MSVGLPIIAKRGANDYLFTTHRVRNFLFNDVFRGLK